jgi:hypothetical protein
MKVPRIYLETTMFNFPFAEDAPDKKNVVLKLFQEIREGKYRPYASKYVVDELSRAGEEKRLKMMGLIDTYQVDILPINEEIERLAAKYIEADIIKTDYFIDAAHIAAATVYAMDFIVSYNFQHIVKAKTIQMVRAINLLENYNEIGIYSPDEVIEYEDE